MFALLPVDTLLITASADFTDPRTGQTLEQPVLSTVITRPVLAGLHFEHLDPSDAIENFLHRGDFKATRKAGAFAPITPLTPFDIKEAPSETSNLRDLVADVRQLREELKEAAAKLSFHPSLPAT